MQKRILIGACCAALTLGLACRSDPGQADERDPTMTAATTGATGQDGLSASWRPADTAPADASEGTVEFAENAFPPLLPSDGLHARPWMRDDCLLCHDGGLGDAPSVQHSGMPGILLEARCRSCHLAVDPDAPPEPTVEFRYNAFPPTLPIDDDHRGGWMRDDCLECHDIGRDGAPKVEHKGMANVLLQVRCRSCHVPRANSVELDLIE